MHRSLVIFKLIIPVLPAVFGLIIIALWARFTPEWASSPLEWVAWGALATTLATIYWGGRKTARKHQLDVDLVREAVNQIENGNLHKMPSINGESPWLHDVLTDISRLHQSMLSLIDDSPLILIGIDMRGEIRDISKAAQKFMGASYDSVVGKSWLEVLQVPNNQEDRAAVSRCLSGNSSEYGRTEATCSGKQYKISYFAIPNRGSDGKQNGGWLFILDQTTRVRAETEAREGIARMDRVLKYQARQTVNLLRVLEHLAKGDLTHRFDVEPPEADVAEAAVSFTQISQALHASLTTLSDLVGEMQRVSMALASGSEELTACASGLLGHAERTKDRTADIAHNAQAALAVSDTALSMSNQTTQVIDRLGSSASEIGKVTNVIKRIAEQTNLLALNATIEAASAGEAGRGFAVVANEVKELARQSAQAADDISTRVESIQGNTSESIAVIKSVGDIIHRISTSVRTITTDVDAQSRSAGTISTSVNQARDGVRNVAMAISEILAATNDISRRIGDIAKGAGATAGSAHEIDRLTGESHRESENLGSAALDLARSASGLQSMANRFILRA